MNEVKVEGKGCKAPEANHVIHYQRLGIAKVDQYCDTCWIAEGISSQLELCPNIIDGENISKHRCSICDTLGEGTLTVSTCCFAPEEWADCELLYDNGDKHGDSECFITICPKCGNMLWRDCLENQ